MTKRHERSESAVDRRTFLEATSWLTFGALGASAFASRAFAAARPTAFDLASFERKRILVGADAYLKEAPLTVTAASSPRSAGGKHDYFSEADYWWPDPKNPSGPYIQRDGESNPENFDEHRKAMRRLSVQMPALTAAWFVTKQKRYAQHAVDHLRAWFVTPETLMNPHLKFSQAIRNKETGRSIGVIDTLHLVEVARAASILEETGALKGADRDGVRTWFKNYLTWMTTHPYGTTERDAKNNHGTCWAVQAAEFARYTGNQAITDDCKDRFKKIMLPDQMAPDGSFPQELRRTKAYGYSLFNIDMLATLCQTLSTPKDDLWAFTLPDGRNMRKGMEYIFPFILDKKLWPKKPDVMYWNEWPIRQPCLIFAGLALSKPEYIELWKKLDGDPKTDEVVRNYPIRQPVLWVDRNGWPRQPAAHV